MNFFNILRVGLLASTICFLFSTNSYSGVPDPNWVTQTTQADCTGAAAQKPGANPGPPDDVCQSYNQDLYENLEAAGNGFCDSDIANYSVGGDPNFYYFEWDMVGDWNNCNGDMVGEGHNYYIAIEIIRDNAGTNVSDNRPDFYFESHYEQGSHVDSGNLNNWIAEFENNVKAFIDTDMPPDAGGPNPLTSDNPSPADGMDTELQTSDSDDAYLRISTNFNPQLAIRASLIGNPTEIRTRAIVFQSSSLGGDKFPWHDHQSTTDLPGQNFDTVCPIGSNCLNSTPITLSYFEALSSGTGVGFSWSTATEAGNAGFNLYAEGEGGREKLNAELIQSSVGDSLIRTDYSYSANSSANVFYISDIDILGKETFHGPFSINNEYGKREAADPIKWAEIKKESTGKKEIREVIKKSKVKKQIKAYSANKDGILTTTSAQGGGNNGGAAAFPSAELSVSTDGLYRVTYEDLQGAGLDLFGVKTSEIALTNNGAPVPLYVKVQSGKSFGPGGYIEFYGQAVDTLYTKTNVYVLQVNADLQLSVDIDKKPVNNKSVFATSYLATKTVENNNAYSFSSPNGDPWYDVRLFAKTSLLTKDFDIELDNVASANGASINVSYYGLTDFPDADPDHHVQTVFNGIQISDDIFNGTTNIEINEDLDTHGVQVTEGTNTLTLNLPGDTGVAFDIVNFEGFSVTYSRTFTAQDGELIFNSASSAYEVTGLDTANVVVYQIAGDGTVTKKEGLNISQTPDGYTAKFAGEKSGEYKYAVYNEEAINTPGINILPDTEDINTGSAQYLVISHPDFIDGLSSLTTARSNTYTVKVVNVDHVYDAYSGGVFDPSAIRAYIAHAESNMGTQYVLLVGGDAYDYLDYNGKGAFSFIPTLYEKTHQVVSFTPSDSLLADTDGDNVQDVAIGRFPVRTSTELASIIQKTLQYPNTDHNSTAVFAADEYDGVVSYTLQSNSLINNLPDTWEVDTVYLDEMSVSDADTKLKSAINEGRALTSYFGHSSMENWTFSGLFSKNDAANLTNADRPTIVTQYGCWNTYFVEPNNNSLGHKFLLEGNKGAAAVMGPTSLTQTSSDSILGNRIVKKLLEGKTLGEASVESKQELASSYESLKDVMLGWTVLGDPALEINQ